jgi:hypothetical protein
MYFSRSSAVFVAISLSIFASSTAVAQQNYEPIPPGFDFPADEATLLRFRDTQNVPEMRRHAWYVFAGMTQRAKNGEAIWETWYPSPSTFSPGPQPLAVAGSPRARPFAQPRQFAPSRGAAPQAIGGSLLSFVMFNKEGNDHVRSNQLNLQATLEAMNNGFPAGTPIEKRDVKPFPRPAMSLKLVWTLVKANGLTPIPVWDNKPARTNAEGNPESSWPRVVAVDPSRPDIPATETADISSGGVAFPKSRVVSLSRFYNFKISATELAAVKAIDSRAEVGDYAAFIAMHYTTKEIPEWIWSTFWWHDEPDNGPYGSDRPTVVSGVWRNYLMNTAYSMDFPHEYDGTPKSAYNPYLEGGFSNGLSSNCMTCHQMARWTKDGPPLSFLPITRGAKPLNDPFFQNTMRLDFLWSVALEAR